MLVVLYRLQVLLLCIATLTSLAQHAKSGNAVLFSFHPISNASPHNDSSAVFQPLQVLAVSGAQGSLITVTDGSGQQYASMPVRPVNTFKVSGALGIHVVRIYNNVHRVVDQLSFSVDAQTNVNDGAYYKEMFDLFYNGMWDKPGQVDQK